MANISTTSLGHSPATFEGFDPYKLTGVTVTKKELGRGSYATVLEVEYMKVKCAGKKIHEILINSERSSINNHVVKRFEQECGILSKIRHPNIIQVLGVYFEEGAQIQVPILVMEFLPINLTTCIQRYNILQDDEHMVAEHEVLPMEISYSILHDVALGLHYLHSQTPPIIHRDLSSNNILLTPYMTAKISDLGVARILDLTPSRVQSLKLLQAPGTFAFMPPEVMVGNPRYNTSVDEFSYGIMMIHLFSGRWPEPQVEPIRIDGDRMIPVTEAERRDSFLRSIGDDHPLMDLIRKCINNVAIHRAHTDEIVDRLAELKRSDISFSNRLEMLRCIQGQRVELKELRDTLESKVQEVELGTNQIRDMTKIARDNVEKQAKEIEALNLAHSTHTMQLSLHIEREQGEKMLLQGERDVANDHILKLESQLQMQSEVLQRLRLDYSTMNSQLEQVVEYLESNKSLPARISYQKCQDLPANMCGGQAVVIDRKVYYGGGEANNKDVCYLVQCYDPSQDEWTTLPPLPVRYFGLGQIYGQLVAVGGERKLQREEFERSKHVYTYDGNGRAWRETLPPMSSALLHPAVISHKSMLVVAGGDHFGVVKRSVEIFRQNQEEAVGKWCRTRKSLQEACFGLSTVSSDSESKLYALGGKNDHGNLNQAIYISTENLHCCSATELDNRTSELADLSLLFSSTDVLRRKQALDDSPWKELPNTVTYSPAASMLGSSLIAIGGWDTADQEGSNVKTNIMMYSSGTNSWIYIGDLPAPRAKITAAVLSLAEVLVIGGWDGQGMSKAVYKLSLLLK